LKKDKHRICKELGFIYIVNGRKFIYKEKAEEYAKLLDKGGK